MSLQIESRVKLACVSPFSFVSCPEGSVAQSPDCPIACLPLLRRS